MRVNSVGRSRNWKTNGRKFDLKRLQWRLWKE